MAIGWGEWILQPFGGFILVLLGTMLLFGEILVRSRLLLFISGLVLMSIYFMPHLQDVQEGYGAWMAALYVIGILLVVVDGKFIGDGTIAGIGLISMLVALALPSPSVFYGISVATAFIIGAFCSLLFLKVLPKREVWSKLALKDTLSSEAGYNSINMGYKELEGQVGIADTDFRPSGTLRIGENQYSAVSDGQWIKKGTSVRVLNVNGTRILVTKEE
jgi:membrane-bound ClpP family serine protease